LKEVSRLKRQQYCSLLQVVGYMLHDSYNSQLSTCNLLPAMRKLRTISITRL